MRNHASLNAEETVYTPFTEAEEAAADASYQAFLDGADAVTLIDVRYKRNCLLAQSDWRELPNAPTTISSEWIAYRQALRALPETYIANPVWPDPPS